MTCCRRPPAAAGPRTALVLGVAAALTAACAGGSGPAVGGGGPSAPATTSTGPAAGAATTPAAAAPASPSLSPTGTRSQPRTAPVVRGAPPVRCAGPTRPANLTVDGRQVLVAAPTGFDGRARLPLVVALPGFGRTPTQLAAQSRLPARGAAAGVLVAIPAGEGGDHAWDFPHNDGVDDSAFLRRVVARLASGACADPARVVITGISDGGDMAAQAACALPGVFRAVVTVAASTSPQTGCRPIRIIAFHGNADPLDPYTGGPDGRPGYPPVPAATVGIAAWAAADGCRTAVGVRLAPDAAGVIYRCGAELVVIHGGGHTWPGGVATEAGLGRTATDVDATGAIIALARG